MDTFTFAVAIILMMIALQSHENWLVFGILALMILTMRSLGGTIVMIVAAIVLYAFSGSLGEYWPFVLFGLITIALVFGGKQKEEGQEYFPQDPYGGMLGGGMGQA